MSVLPAWKSPLVIVRTPPAWPGARIGLMGGSFNPAHAAHRMVALTALRRLRLDRVWWLVSPGNPLKSGREHTPLAARAAQASAVARHPRISVTTFESSLGTRYTIDALRFLARRHPRVRFVWVMGADGLAELHRWRRWKDLARLAPLAVVDRPGYRLAAVSSPAARWMAGRRLPAADAARLPTAKPPAWTLLATRLSPLSSTQLRARMVNTRTTI